MEERHSAVFSHFRAQPPYPGYDASHAKLAGGSQIHKMFDGTHDNFVDGLSMTAALENLKTHGYTVMDTGVAP